MLALDFFKMGRVLRLFRIGANPALVSLRILNQRDYFVDFEHTWFTSFEIDMTSGG
jgi:hypothetical protein